MLDPDFICCCIPLINSGIYFILLEHLVVGIVAGVVTLVPSAVVGSAVPSFTAWIFAILCFAVAGIQILGLLGVVKEKKGLFKVYMITNITVQLVTFTVAAVLILVSGLRHNTAVATCKSTYYSSDNSTSTASLASESQKICEIFAIVDASLMGGLWLILFIVQSYLMGVTRLYKHEQKEDHSRYFSMYSTKGGFPEEAENIPLASHHPDPAGDIWTTRRSTDTVRAYPNPYAEEQAYRKPEVSEGYVGEEVPYGAGHQDGYVYPHQPFHQDRGFEPPLGGNEGYGREEVAYRDHPEYNSR